MVRGKKPMPTALKLVAGTNKRYINDDEPQPSEGIPQCPTRNTAILEVWDYTVKELVRMGVITMADRDALATYCEAVVTHRLATELAAREGLVLPNGKPHPAVRIAKEAAMMIKGFAAEFGLTPSGRTRIRVKAASPEAGTGAARLLSS